MISEGFPPLLVSGCFLPSEIGGSADPDQIRDDGSGHTGALHLPDIIDGTDAFSDPGGGIRQVDILPALACMPLQRSGIHHDQELSISFLVVQEIEPDAMPIENRVQKPDSVL